MRIQLPNLSLLARSLPLGRIGGVMVRVHASFVLLLAFVAGSAWMGDGGSDGGLAAALQALAYVLLVFACVVAHEFGHIGMARLFGFPTLYVLLLPIGGVAGMPQLPRRPGQELLVALAGPAVNVVIAAGFALALGPDTLLRALGQDAGLWADVGMANVVLAGFNLLPAFPMDGGRALRAVLSLGLGRGLATRAAMVLGLVIAAGLAGFALWQGMPLLVLLAGFVGLAALRENAAAQNELRAAAS